MKILLTGAHFTPAQAVIEYLQTLFKNNPEKLELVYIGRKYTQEGDKALSVESQLLPKLNVKFYSLTAGRLRRFISVQTFISLFKVPIGFIQSFFILLNEKPDVVVSFGGYVGVPVVISAWLLSIPVLIHEQTLVNGLANTISRYFATKVAVTFKQTTVNKDDIVTGNPIRKELLNPDNVSSPELEKLFKESKRNDLPIILITGGNQGSHVINETVEKILDKLLKKYLIIHQTGDSKYQDFEHLSKLKEELDSGERYFVSKFIQASDFGNILKNANLVISRAGANTLLELALFSVPTIVIPIPYLSRNEQMKNAAFFKKAGLCEILAQKDLTSEKLLELIDEKIKDKDLKIRAKNAKEVVVLNAAENISRQILNLTERDE